MINYLHSNNVYYCFTILDVLQLESRLETRCIEGMDVKPVCDVDETIVTNLR